MPDSHQDDDAVPRGIDEVLQQERFALVIVDVQNDFTHPDGLLGSEGRAIEVAPRVISAINEFQKLARSAGIPTFFTQTASGGAAVSQADQLIRSESGRGHRVACAEGTWGAELDSSLNVHPDDTIVRKTRYSAFVDTDLQALLNERGCSGIIVCGFTADVCVDATARHAFMLDYHVIVVPDLTGSVNPDNKSSALASMQKNFVYIRTSHELELIWAT